MKVERAIHIILTEAEADVLRKVLGDRSHDDDMRLGLTDRDRQSLTGLYEELPTEDEE